MKTIFKTLALGLLALAAALGPSAARAQGYTHATLHSFGGTNRPGPYGNADGANPKAGVVRDSSGNLFGTTNAGGTGGINGNGTVYEIPVGATTATTLHVFTGTDGGGSVAGVVLDSLGDIFGTTTFGGAGGAGTVFELVKTGAGYTFTTLYSFTNRLARQSANTDGGVPLAGVVLDGQGDVFGTTYYGGANGNGVVFEIVKTGTGYATTVPTIHSFTPLDRNGFNADGANPAADLAFDGGGNLLGTASAGGTSGNGTVFKFAAGTNAFSTVHSFTGTSGDGADPEGGVIFDAQGNLFGTTQSGGTAGFGAVYEIASGTTTPTTLYSFGVAGSTPSYPLSTLAVDSSGSLYGTTSRGGANDRGTVFKLTKNANSYSFSLLHDFTNPDAAGINGSNADGGRPNSVILDGSSNVLGTAQEGGANGDGTVFKIAAGTTTLTTLYSFSGLSGATGTGTDGANPMAGLLRDAQGNLYGTTTNGGTSGNGTVFKIAARTTAPVTLHSFSALTSSVSSGSGVNADGAQPAAALTVDAQGNLFGTTEHGGANGFGSVFEIAAGTTTLSTLYSFTGFKSAANPGAQNPEAGVTLDGSGNLFGTTYQGGTGNVGTVFELVKANNYAYVSVHSFTGGFDAGANTDGAYPQAALALDGSGNLFGTTDYGGASGQGTVFKITAGTNAFSTVHSFAGGTGDGATPLSSLAIDGGGNLFGTTFGGGTGAKGVVYELVKTGTGSTGYAAATTLLYSFTGTGPDGANPDGLAFDAGGSLFGTTLNGGASGQGTVFELVKTGTGYAATVPTLYSFTGTGTTTDGAQPLGGVVLDTQGNLFGMTQTGGTTGQGTVFELSPALTRSAHTYVSHSGADSGPCSRSAPCATFAYALSKTLPGGTVTAVNAGEYGPVFIVKAVTIDGEGTQAGITAANAVTISAGTGDAVVLRHLNLNGTGGPFGAGITINSVGSLVVDDCRVAGFVTGLLGGNPSGSVLVEKTIVIGGRFGIDVSSPFGRPLVSLRDITIQGAGIGLEAGFGVTDIKDSLITQNTLGLLAQGNSTLSVSGCTLTGNGTAVESDANSIVRLTNNDIYNNGTAISNSGTISSTGNNRRAGNANATNPPAATDQPNKGITVQ